MAWIKCFNTFTCDALLHTADSTPSTQRCLFFVTPPIVCRTLWKACSVLFQLGYCINVSSSAWMPEGLWMPVGLIPADQWDCPCLETAHTTTLFLPCLLSRPEADQTSGTAACEAAFPTSYFHRLFGKIHLELIRAEGFSENGTGNALSDSRSHTLNGNLNKKHPHHCALSLSLSLSNLHTPVYHLIPCCKSHIWNLCIDGISMFTIEAYLSVAYKRWKMTHKDKLTTMLLPFQFSFQPQCA